MEGLQGLLMQHPGQGRSRGVWAGVLGSRDPTFPMVHIFFLLPSVALSPPCLTFLSSPLTIFH